MKQLEKIAGIIILISTTIIVLTYFFPVFHSQGFKDSITPSMIVFGREYHTTLTFDNSSFEAKFFNYIPLFLVYVLPIIPAILFWVMQMTKPNVYLKYGVYFITLLSFVMGLMFFITAHHKVSFIRTDIENAAIVQIKNFGYKPTIYAILTLIFSSFGVLSSSAALVKTILVE